MTAAALNAAFARYRASPTDDRFAELNEAATRYAYPLRRTFPGAQKIDGDRYDDAVQDVILRLSAPGTAGGIDPGRFAGIFRRSVRNALIDQTRRIKRRKDNVSLNAMAEEEIFGREEPLAADVEALQAKIGHAVERCAPEAVRAWRDHAEGMKLAEIAGREGVPEGTIKGRVKAVYRALRSNPALEQELQEYRPEELTGLTLGR